MYLGLGKELLEQKEHEHKLKKLIKLHQIKDVCFSEDTAKNKNVNNELAEKHCKTHI